MARGGDLAEATGGTWQQIQGKHVDMHFLEGSSVAGMAPNELAEADRAVGALLEILGAAAPADPRVAVYLVDPIAETPEESLGDQGLVRAVRVDAPSTPIAFAIARAALRRWFGAGAAQTYPFADGVAAAVAAATGAGPSAMVVDESVRELMTTGAEVSVAHPPEALPAAPEGAEGASTSVGDPVATSFTFFLLESHGPEKLAAVLRSMDPSDPDAAATEVYGQPLAALEGEWFGRLMGGSSGASTLGSLKFLLPLLKPHRWKYIEVLGYMVVTVAVTLALPIATGCVVNALGAAGLPPGASPPAEGLCKVVAPTLTIGRAIAIVLILLAMNIVAAGLEMRRAYVQAQIFKKIGITLQERMFGHLQRLPHRFYSQARVGDLSSRLSDDLGGVEQATSMIFGQGMFMAMTSFLAAVTALTQNPYVGALVLLIIPVFVMAHRTLGGRIAIASYEAMEIGGEVAAVAQENLSAHSVIKAYGLEEKTMSTYRSRLADAFKATLRMTIVGQLFEGSITLTTAFAQLLVLAIGSIFVINGTIDDPGTMVTLLLLLPTVFVPIGLLADVGQTVQLASGSIQRANEILEEPIEIENKPDAIELPPLQQKISLEGVTFGYEPGRPILKGLDLTIDEGTNVAIVGPSGSGKSTILNLILRFYDPDAGRVTIDGTDLRDVTLESLRSQIGLVFQDTFIFNASVRENIAIGKADATDEEIEAAAHAAQLDAFIESQPEGMETVLGERGSRMSGGQRQRLAIARALLRDPRILMLDEATSALDARTEAEILETLSTVVRGRTTISITHRLTLAAAADLVLVLDKGNLVERGPHSQLVEAGGLYQKLYEEQTAHISAPKPKLGLEAARLRKIPFFADLDGDVLLNLAERLASENYSEGDDIVRQGDIGEKLYILASGAADVIVDDGAGPRTVNRLRGGDYFGEYALLADEPRTATVRASMPTEVYSLDKTEFVAMMESEPRMQAFVERYLEQRREAFAAAAAAAGTVPAGAAT